MDETKYIAEDRISFREVIDRIRDFIFHLLYQWKKIVVASLILSAFYISYQLIRKPVYTAETTFVLESGSQNQMGQLSSLASAIGFNFGSMGGKDGLFQTENITVLYSSRRMLQAVFLSREEIEDSNERLITRYGRDKELEKRWKKELGPEFTFEVDDSKLTVAHDSIMYEVLKDFREKQLIVEKPDRKLTIMSVRVTDKDPLFAKRFNERLVENVNQFYQETKTKKSGENLAILQSQADSVKAELDRALVELAEASENTPNPNPVFQSSKVSIQKAKIQVETCAAVYEELVKNLEIAKISHRDNMPLIQIIDRPILPLISDKDKAVKMVLKGGFISGILVILFLSFLYIYNQAMTDTGMTKEQE